MPAAFKTPVQKGVKPSKKTRVVKRRGRVNNGLESDEEIEREARTDSDTDEDSSLASESDSETASDDENHAGIVTPSTTQSPPPLDITGPSSSLKAANLANGTAGPFVSTTDWAQLVADENANGASDLPVIDFADMHTHVIPEPQPAAARPRKAQKQSRKKSTPHVPQEPPSETKPEVEELPPPVADEPVASTSRAASTDPDAFRPRGQTARQAYQQRLQVDPAFVPRVGEFWGHDDRLLDKDLRSLSPWWRGRWQTRGRGRGGFSMRGRGGRPFPPGTHAHEEEQKETEVAQEEIPAIDRAWTHDGFEEMKRREEVRREEQRRFEAQQQFAHQPAASQRGSAFRGRGGPFMRGRGSISRGGALPHVSPRSMPAQDTTINRPWFAMKPEKVWTKQSETFLYMEPVLRARPGQGPGLRVKLPGRDGQVIRGKKQTHYSTFSIPFQDHTTVTSTAALSDLGERQFIVRFPCPLAAKETITREVPSVAEAAPQEAATFAGTELSIEEVFTIRPHAVPNHVPLVPPPTTDVAPQPSSSQPVSSPSSPITELPASNKDGEAAFSGSEASWLLEQVGMGGSIGADSATSPSAEIQASVLRTPQTAEVFAPVPQAPAAVDESRPVPPVLHPLQTTFSPIPPTSPPYGSPYSFGPTLPPGIAMSHQGFPYDVATGQAVYLQPTPPPMFTPRPMMHGYMGHPSTSLPFVPGHMHHPSQEYVPQIQTPPVSGFIDPATGVPIFAPARQNSRIEIRAPSEYGGKSLKHVPRPSGLRTTTSEADSAEPEPTADTTSESWQQQQQQHQPHPVSPPMMAYVPYPQQYYYPDPNGYPPYMDMSQPVMQYEVYPPHDQHPTITIGSTKQIL
ncbi:hypothetical protein PHLCEN_2v4691 [Hermanssonia centrifuga]|uniref:Btz domain-containing protein n=1 Tax=Hermanssonia centrifuga TaxID=98765 RepID=A0A2R6PN17_9APHY|nr:hypothetical protein PHLCEN_2v4691 [Hermanssonia centrifuga]